MHRACLRSQDVYRGTLAVRNDGRGIAIDADLLTHSEGGKIDRHDGTTVMIGHKHIKANREWTPAAQGRNRQQESTPIHRAPIALRVREDAAPGVELRGLNTRALEGSQPNAFTALGDLIRHVFMIIRAGTDWK